MDAAVKPKLHFLLMPLFGCLMPVSAHVISSRRPLRTVYALVQRDKRIGIQTRS